MRRVLAIEREQDTIWLLPSFEAALAEAEAGAGETDAGLRRLDDALAELEQTEQRWYEAEMHSIRAKILLKRDPAHTVAAEQSVPGCDPKAPPGARNRFGMGWPAGVNMPTR